MPDNDDDFAENGDDSPVIRELRHKARRADAAEAETVALRTENAILKAGLTDLTPAKQKALLAAHEGDMDTEAIRKTAIELGFLTEPAPAEPEPQVPADEQAAHQRIAEATAGAQPAEASPETLNDRIAKAKNPRELEAILAEAGISVNAVE